jgi:hypothetical protein
MPSHAPSLKSRNRGVGVGDLLEDVVAAEVGVGVGVGLTATMEVTDPDFFAVAFATLGPTNRRVASCQTDPP